MIRFNVALFSWFTHPNLFYFVSLFSLRSVYDASFIVRFCFDAHLCISFSSLLCIACVFLFLLLKSRAHVEFDFTICVSHSMFFGRVFFLQITAADHSIVLCVISTIYRLTDLRYKKSNWDLLCIKSFHFFAPSNKWKWENSWTHFTLIAKPILENAWSQGVTIYGFSIFLYLVAHIISIHSIFSMIRKAKNEIRFM